MKRKRLCLSVLLAVSLAVAAPLEILATDMEGDPVQIQEAGQAELEGEDYEMEMQEQEAYLNELDEADLEEAMDASDEDLDDTEEVMPLGEEVLEPAEGSYTVEETDSEIVVKMEADCTGDDIRGALYQFRPQDGRTLTVNVLTPGRYVLSRKMILYSDTTLHSAEGVEYSILTNSCSMLGLDNLNNDVGGFEQAQNVTVDGGCFNGNGKKGEMLRFIHASNVTVRNVSFRDAGDKSHMLTLEGVNNARVENCVFDGYISESNVRSTNWDWEPGAKEALHIDIVHNSAIAPGTDCYDDAPVNNLVVTGCTFRNVPRGVGSHSGVKGVFHRNITIENNVFQNIYFEAIKTYSYRDSAITGNYIEDAGRGITSHTLLGGVDKFYFDPLPGTVTEEIPGEAQGYDYNLLIQDNTMENLVDRYPDETKKPSYGIAVVGHADYPLGGVQVIGNQIGGVSEAGDIVSSGEARLGVYLNTSAVNNTVTENEIGTVTKYGIVLRVGSEGNTIENNRIGQPGFYGVYLTESGSNTIHGNLVIESARSSIALSKSENCDIQENRIRSSKAGGILLTESSHTPVIRKNTVYNPQKNGIYVSGCDTVKILSNNIHRVYNTFAVCVKDCVALNTSYNSFTNTTKTPIYLLRVTKANTTSFGLLSVDKIAQGSTRIRGTVGKAGSTVTVTVEGTTYKTVVSDDKTFTSYLIPALARGTRVAVEEVDVKGNSQKVGANVA